MKNYTLNQNVNYILHQFASKNSIIIKDFILGTKHPLNAVLIYINVLSNKNLINRDVLYPLMIEIDEDLSFIDNTCSYLCKKYIPMSNTTLDTNIHNSINSLKSGKSVLLIEGVKDFIIIDTTGGTYRSITEPSNETCLRSSREGFIENLETNLSMLKRNIRDKNLVIEIIKVGRRSQKDLALVYINDIIEPKILTTLKKKIKAIDVDYIGDISMIEQFIEDNSYSIFPQFYGTEKPDIVEANLMEGRVAILLNGSPYVLTAPSLFIEFFQSVEDYYERTIISSFVRILRLIAVFISITLPSIYLTLIKFNGELIPIQFIIPIVQSRQGIALTPFWEILSIEIVVEFLREGGLRLPSKVAQTLSIIGGIIIGDTVIQSKVISPSTLLVVGITVVSTFLIPKYEMSLSIRFLRFPMLLLANVLGGFGISAGWFFILVHLFSLKSIGVSYLSLKKADLKDLVIRAPLWKMNLRPESIPNKNKTRQNDFKMNFRRNKK